MPTTGPGALKVLFLLLGVWPGSIGILMVTGSAFVLVLPLVPFWVGARVSVGVSNFNLVCLASPDLAQRENFPPKADQPLAEEFDLTFNFYLLSFNFSIYA